MIINGFIGTWPRLFICVISTAIFKSPWQKCTVVTDHTAHKTKTSQCVAY